MNATTKCLFCCVVIAWTLGSGTPDAGAASITYEVSGIGSGSLGSTAFDNAAINIISTADTSEIINLYPGAYQVPTTSTTIAIEGFPSATFTTPTAIYASYYISTMAGIGSPSQNVIILFGRSDLLNGYSLDQSIGPFTIEGLINPKLSFATTAGGLMLSNVPIVTFQAKVIPEPSIAALLAIGCVVALTPRQRRNYSCGRPRAAGR